MLSRTDMERVIQSGGSVLHGGRILTKLEHLPTEADLAVGNPEQEAVAAAALEAQIAALQAQYDRLTQAKTPRTVHGTIGQGGAPLELGTQIGGFAQPALADVVGEEIAARLAAAGYGTPEAIAQAN